MNEPGGAFNFGTALPLELDRIEVVRGAASSLYGTDALAGVIHLVTRHGRRGAPGVARGGAKAGASPGGGRGRHLGCSRALRLERRAGPL